MLELKFTDHSAACHFPSVRTDILDAGAETRPEVVTLSEWPSGRPSDEQASTAMRCEPGGTPHMPERLGDDVVVDEEGEVVHEGAAQ